jgi:penicillin amidase
MKNLILLITSFLFIPLSFSRCPGFADQMRISHVKVENKNDFFYCLGFLQARDRAWQMFYFRQLVKGELAETLGYSMVKQDFQMRLLDLYGRAKIITPTLSQNVKNFYFDYVKGINAGIIQHLKNPSPEFKEVSVHQGQWLLEDSIALMLLQAFDQTKKTFIQDIKEQQWMEVWGDQAAELFNPDGIPWQSTILKKGDYQQAPMSARLKSSEKKPLFSFNWIDIFGKESGSNSWVVGPQKTKEKIAILSNDPHLDLKTPLFWYWAHLSTSEDDVIGASFPGTPLIVSGTNRLVTWGLTNSYFKTGEAYTISSAQEKKLTKLRPIVWFKWLFLKIPIFFKTFYETSERHPILPTEGLTENVALHWSGFYANGGDFEAVSNMMFSKSAQEMNQHLKNIGVPSWNFVFADREGHIGHRVVGRLFKITEEPSFGLKKDFTKNFLDPEDRPHAFNPARHFIATANNRHFPEDSIYHGGRGYSFSFRHMRIEEKLQRDDLTAEDMMQIQFDNQAVDARFFRELLMSALDPDINSKARQALAEWNLSTGKDCYGCYVYRRLMELSMDELKVNETAFYKLLMKQDPDVIATIGTLSKNSIENKPLLKWEKAHKNSFPHLSGVKELTYAPFIFTHGDEHSVDPGSSKWENDYYQHYSGASQRLIVELKESPVIHLSLPGLNARYWEKASFDPWNEWAQGVYKKVHYPVDWTQVKLSFQNE